MAERYYRVRKGITDMVEETIVRSAPTAQFAELLSTPRDNNVMFLPANTRHMFAEGQSGKIAFVIELPPMVRTLSWAGGGGQPRKQYTLALPWVYFIFAAQRTDPNNINSPLGMNGWGVFCAPNRVMTVTDPLKALPVNNVYEDGRICIGTAAAPPGQNIGQHIDNLITAFWNSDFNYDVWPSLPQHIDYDKWQKDSETDPMCWTKWPWTDNARWNLQNRTMLEAAQIAGDRTTLAIAPDPIPDLPMGATFGRVEEWLAGLQQQQRERLTTAMTPRT